MLGVVEEVRGINGKEQEGTFRDDGNNAELDGGRSHTVAPFVKIYQTVNLKSAFL